MVVKEAVERGAARLSEAGVPDAKTDVYLLLEAAAGLSRGVCMAHPETLLSKEEETLFQSFLSRREKREPCQYIIGRCEFYGLPFRVRPGVLIPRQDTEVLVEETLSALPECGAVLDLCTGSGAIAVAVKKTRPDAQVTATDISEEALSVAKENSRDNGCEITFLKSDLFETLKTETGFDVIVSNPPYVTENEYATLMPEVKDYEPKLALTAGEDGLSIYRRLIKDAPSFLKPGGTLLVEIGCTQADAVSQLLKEAQFEHIRVTRDLSGLDRVVSGRRKDRM